MFSLLNQRRDFEQELTKHRLQLDDNLSIPVSFVSAIQMGADLNLKKRSLEIAFLLYQGQKLLFLLRSLALSEQFNAIKAIRKWCLIRMLRKIGWPLLTIRLFSVTARYKEYAWDGEHCQSAFQRHARIYCHCRHHQPLDAQRGAPLAWRHRAAILGAWGPLSLCFSK